MDEAALNFRRLLEDEINKRVNYDQDLIRQSADVQAELGALPATLREQFATSAIRDPFAQERLIAQKSSGLGSQLSFLNSLRERRGGRYGEIVGNASEGINAILADRERARAAASSGGGYADLINSILSGGQNDPPPAAGTNGGDTPGKPVDLTKSGITRPGASIKGLPGLSDLFNETANLQARHFDRIARGYNKGGLIGAAKANFDPREGIRDFRSIFR